MAAATALLAADARQARPARRGRRQGRPPVAVRADGRSASRPREVHPGRARDGDGHRGVAAGVPAAQPARARDRAARARSPRCSTSSPTAAPGVKEILTVGKIVWEVRESIEGRADFDLVVVDAAASGHIVAQLGAAEADPGAGRRRAAPRPDRLDGRAARRPARSPRSTSSRRRRRCRSPRRSSSSRGCRAEVEAPLGAVIVNRVLPELFTHADEETFEALRAARRDRAR